MQPGNYGVVQTGGWIGRMIQRATHSWANHAFICLGEGKIIEAMPGGVQVGSLDEYRGARIAFNTGEEMSDTQRSAVVESAHRMVGEEYNFTDIGALGLQALGWTWRVAFKLAGADHDAVICSQLVALCGQAAGLDWLCGKPSPLYVTPADLARRNGVL